MARLSRRALVVGAAGAAVLGCGGVGGGGGEAPEPEAAPPAPAIPPSARAAAAGEPGTLFPVRQDVREELPQLGEIPAWFRAAPALWAPSPRSGGGALLSFSQRADSALCRRLTHFRDLPKLLDLAKRQGTSVLYLVDWYEGRPDLGGCEEAVRNEGDYLPRSDLGGAAGLKEGIAALHEAGGRVLLFVDPLVVDPGSELGRSSGAAWAIRPPDGAEPDPAAPFRLCPASPEVRAYLVGVARRIFGDYGADGLHLGGYGAERGWTCAEAKHGHPPGDAKALDDGVKQVVAEVLAEARAHAPDAVVMCEGSELPSLFRSVSASQEWGLHTLTTRWVWRVAGQAPIFSAGWSLDDVHQILALGHKLALAGDWALEAPRGSLVDELDRLFPADLPDPGDERQRRFLADEAFQRLHAWRNAGLLLGRPMPNVDQCTPRHGDRPEAFRSHQGLLAILDECRSAAQQLDLALVGAGELPSLEVHVRALLDARAAFDRAVNGATIRVLDTGEPNVAAYAFDGPLGQGASAVSVDGKPVELPIRVADGEWRELVAGGTSRATGGAIRASLPPHALRLWTKAA